MNIDEQIQNFNTMPWDRRLSYFVEHATFLSARTLSDLNVELYKVENFFVELWYDTRADGSSIMMKSFN